MKKKRLVIAIVCILLTVLMLGGLFSAACWVLVNADDFQFGGLVGELMAEKDAASSDEETTDSAAQGTERESLEELVTDNTHTEVITNVIKPPMPGGTPALRFFLGGCDAWIEDSQMQEFFRPGYASEWDHRAVIDDYNVEYVRLWGWAAIFAETPMQLGYQIDDGQPVYGENAEFYEADQAATTAALGMGAIRAAGVLLEIPVQNLSGTHTVKILVRNHGGLDEGVISTFTIEKAEPPVTKE